jgi:hypothetical protein
LKSSLTGPVGQPPPRVRWMSPMLAFDALNVVVQVSAADGPGADVVVSQLGGAYQPAGRSSLLTRL